ncbi:MAG TPA: phage portal protein, partial [Devosia sp.]
MNLLDKILLPVAPGVVAKRIASRQKAMLHDEQVRRYEGAAKGRRFESFLGTSGSPNKEIAQDIKLLRERSRNLAKNN